MALSLLQEIAIRFIGRDRNRVRLALLVAECVPILQRQMREGVVRRVRHGLEEFARASHQKWEIVEHLRTGPGRSKHWDRYRLQRSGKDPSDHWSRKGFSGIWFQVQWFAHAPRFRVGVEWPKDGVSVSAGAVRECFEAFGAEISDENHGGGDGVPPTRWFYGFLGGKEWTGWEMLLSKTDDDVRAYVDRTVALMQKLVAAIDREDDSEGREGSG